MWCSCCGDGVGVLRLWCRCCRVGAVVVLVLWCCYCVVAHVVLVQWCCWCGVNAVVLVQARVAGSPRWAEGKRARFELPALSFCVSRRMSVFIDTERGSERNN